jgi:hypothetical protein
MPPRASTRILWLAAFTGWRNGEDVADRHAADSTTLRRLGREHDIGQRDAVDVACQAAGRVGLAITLTTMLVVITISPRRSGLRIRAYLAGAGGRGAAGNIDAKARAMRMLSSVSL